MSEVSGFTKTQKRLLSVLRDGRVHTKRELRDACGDCSVSTFHAHLTYLRRRLRMNHPELDVMYVSTEESAAFQLVRISPAVLAEIQ